MLLSFVPFVSRPGGCPAAARFFAVSGAASPFAPVLWPLAGCAGFYGPGRFARAAGFARQCRRLGLPVSVAARPGAAVFVSLGGFPCPVLRPSCGQLALFA